MPDSSGIGTATALKLAVAGEKVGIAARRADKLVLPWRQVPQ